MELDLLKLLSTKDLYDKYSGHIKTDRLTSDIKDLFQGLDEYYVFTGAVDVLWSSFYTWYSSVKHPNISDAKAKILEAYCKKLDGMSGPNDHVLKAFLERDYSAQIADMCQDIVDGTGSAGMTDVSDLVESYKAEARVTDQFLEGENVSIDDIEEQLAEQADCQKFEWRLNELQISLGSIQQGDFIIVGARPDSGKTTFLASEVTFFASQLEPGQCILWLNNEEMLSRVKGRQVQAALGWKYSETRKDLAITKAEFVKALGGPGRLVTYDNSSMTISDVDRAVARYKPSMIIIDQLWKLGGYEKESTSEVDRFARIANHLRSLAKEVGPVIVTSQLDGSADGEKWPGMNTIYNSKTAVQGEADAIIMIGIDLGTSVVHRYIKAPKNKLPFGQHKYRNAAWIVDIDAEHARYISATPIPRNPAP